MKKLLLLLLLPICFKGQNLKISELPAASALTGTEVTVVVQNGGTKKSTVTAIRGSAGTTTLTAGSNVTVTGTNPYTITAGGVPYTGATSTVNLNTQPIVAGRLSFGTANPILTSQIYMGSNTTGNVNFQNIFLETQVQSDVTNSCYGFLSNIGTQAAPFNLAGISHFTAVKGVFGAGSTVTDHYGFLAGNITGATNNYGFYGQATSASGVWNLYMAGTASNYLAGKLGIGVTLPSATLDVSGTMSVSSTSTLNGIVIPSFTTAGQAVITTSTGALTTTTFPTGGGGGSTLTAANNISITGTNPYTVEVVSSPTFTNATITNTLQIGSVPNYTDTGTFLQYTGGTNGYLQSIISNTNSGAAASINHIVSNNLGTATTFYGEFGMNSSTFTGTAAYQRPNAVYVVSQSSDLSLCTASANAIHISANSSVNDAITISSANAVAINSALTVTGTAALNGQVTLADNINIAVNTTNGTRIGTATTQKLGFYNATPVVQQTATTDLGTVLSNLGFRASGTAYPLTSSGNINFTGTSNSITNLTVPTTGTITGYVTRLGSTTTQSAVPQISTNRIHFTTITGLAQAITSVTMTGTPFDGQLFEIRITDNGTARAITWGSQFEGSLLPTTTVISTRLRIFLEWDAATSRWFCVGSI